MATVEEEKLTLDNAIKMLTELSNTIKEDFANQECFYEKRANTATEKIEYFRKMLVSKKLDPLTTEMAKYAATNECQILMILAEERMITNLLSQTVSNVAFSVAVIGLEFAKNKSKDETKMDKEKISKLEQELQKLQTETKNMRPYIRNLKQGIKNKNRWLNKNR